MTEIAMPAHTGSVQALTVGQVAETFGVTVRTLHHYDEVGLLPPSERTRAGYRLYTSQDLQRLGTIVVYRRLGFALEEIGELLEADGAEVVDHLRRQRDLVRDRLARMTELVDAIEHALEAEMTDRPATTEDLKALFGDGYNEEYQAQAQQRWGDTDKWRQSQQRTEGMTRAQWARVKAETETFESDLGAAVRAGEPVDGDAAATLAERHRASIERFYDCDHEFQVCLAQMYLSDPRFTQHYEDIEPGAAQWLHDAIVANAERHAG
ncbi:MerR family transcriptional regulator [Janibacter alittae]|uniref:MerR family transcriptional regulator n=1 Tax=Janibacter alittae TaxID=3115209 RepID=A0ABZ2MH77_9MICO